MTWLGLIAVCVASLAAMFIGVAWASAFSAARTAQANASCDLARAQADAIKTQVDGQLAILREEAIREAARRENP